MVTLKWKKEKNQNDQNKVGQSIKSNCTNYCVSTVYIKIFSFNNSSAENSRLSPPQQFIFVDTHTHFTHSW